MDTVTIVGVGLIGGSFALALRQAGFTGRLIGVSSPATLSLARELGVIDEGAELEAAVRSADLVYLAQPVHSIIDTLPRLKTWLKPGALVTDAGSTKSRIVSTALEYLAETQFLGGHPMAGKESTGVRFAEAALFTGRPYLLTPVAGVLPQTQAVEELTGWLGRIGSYVHVLPPEEHDYVVATTSHVPQLASTALSLLVSERLKDGQAEALAGPGLRSMTRLAASDYGLWRDILATNEGEIGPALDHYIALLQTLRNYLCTDKMAEQFCAGSHNALKMLSVTPTVKKIAN